MKKVILKSDFDLDVLNSLKEFPINEEDSYIYIRATVTDEGINKRNDGHINTKGTLEALQGTLLTFIASSKDAKEITLNAVLNFFNNNPKEIKEFKKHLSSI